MKEIKYIIKDEMGMHARPAGLFVKEAASYPCQITVEFGGKTADAKRILNLMGLCIKCGSEITLRAEGPQEEDAVAGLEKFLQENL